MKRRTTRWGLLLLLLLAILPAGCRKQQSRLVLGGGPTGGTFQNFAISLERVINQGMSGVHVTAEHTGGSIDNLLQVDRGKIQMALVYAGDAYLARRGELRGEPAAVNVRALARLYSAAAQVVVPQGSSVQTPYDLRHKRIAIGNPGSGSAFAAQRFFSSLGIWEEIIPIYVGFDMGLDDLRRKNVDAVWLLVGFPNGSLRKFSSEEPIRFLDLFDTAAASGFFKTYPYYAVVRIPAGTYSGQERDVLTFQDAVLWVANPRVNEDFVCQALKLLFSEKGLAKMRSVDPVASDLIEEKGLTGITIPLHFGAERFWRERGTLLIR